MESDPDNKDKFIPIKVVSEYLNIVSSPKTDLVLEYKLDKKIFNNKIVVKQRKPFRLEIMYE